MWPAALLYLTLAVPFWRVDVAMGQPDVTAWLEVVAIVVALKGVTELVLTWRAFSPRAAIRRWSEREVTSV